MTFGRKRSISASSQPGLALSTPVPPHSWSAERHKQAGKGATRTLPWERELTRDHQEPEELLRTNSVEVSGFTNNSSHADSRYSEWQKQYLERQLCIFTPQVYKRNCWQALFSIILIYIPIKWYLLGSKGPLKCFWVWFCLPNFSRQLLRVSCASQHLRRRQLAVKVSSRQHLRTCSGPSLVCCCCCL